jgi:hypothetical protein
MTKMKKVVLIGLVILIMATPIVARSKDSKTEPSRKNLFVFKADKKFIGAQVEVLYGNGEVVTSQTLSKRKMLIDFSDMKSGSYMIRVKKGSDVQQFTFEKK